MTKVLISIFVSSQPGSAVTPGALQSDKKQPQLWMEDAYPATSRDSVAARGLYATMASPKRFHAILFQ